MDRFRELTAFVAVAETGAFNRAALRLGMTPPVVTRLVAALEARLGVRLLRRTTRKVSTTDAGARLLSDGMRILSELDAVEAQASGARQTPRGVLRVTAPVLFGQRHILPILREFLDAYPEMSATTLFVDRIVDLIDEGLDVALRIGELPDSSLTATKVGVVRRVTVAAPDYLVASGTPTVPEDLIRHRTIQTQPLEETPIWQYVAAGRNRGVKIAPVLKVNTATASIDSALAGWGIARALSYQVADALADGSLVEILTSWEDRDMPLHLIHSEGRLSAAKIRAFVDFAGPRLRKSSVRFNAL